MISVSGLSIVPTQYRLIGYSKPVDLISEHQELTGSKRAEDILANWNHFIQSFMKILPQDYERVLMALKRAEERGLKGDEAVQAAFEENVAAGN